MSQTPALVGTSRKSVAKVLRSSLVLQVVSALVGVLVLPRVLDGIGAYDYGLWATLAAILAIGQLAQSGASTEIARRVATAHGAGDREAMREAVRQGVTVLVGIATLLEIIGILLARPVVNFVFSGVSAAERDQLTLLLIGMVTLLGVGLVGNGYFSILVGLQRRDYVMWSAVASLLVGAVATVAGVAAGFGLWALFMAQCIQLMVSWVGPVIGVRRLAPDLRFRLVRVPRAVVIGFITMPGMLMMASASDVFDSQVDKLVLTRTVNPTASAMFQIGAGLVQSSRGLVLVPLAVMLAGTAELYRSDPHRLRRLETLADSSVQAIAAITAGGLVLFAVPFVETWLGPGYGDAALCVQVLALAALINAWSAPWTYYAIGRGRYSYVLISAGVTLAVNAAATIILTSRIGLNGALIGSLAGSAAGTATARLLLLRWERRNWLSPAVRATGTVGLLVVPTLLIGVEFPASWLGLFGWSLAYIAAAGLLLLATRSLPFTAVVKRGATPQLAWRGERGRP